MIFLLEYDRRKGVLVSFKGFGEGQSPSAEQARLEMELDLNRRGVDREVVLLEAENEKALRRTHRRYFEDLAQLVS